MTCRRPRPPRRPAPRATARRAASESRRTSLRRPPTAPAPAAGPASRTGTTCWRWSDAGIPPACAAASAKCHWTLSSDAMRATATSSARMTISGQLSASTYLNFLKFNAYVGIFSDICRSSTLDTFVHTLQSEEISRDFNIVIIITLIRYPKSSPTLEDSAYPSRL